MANKKVNPIQAVTYRYEKTGQTNKYGNSKYKRIGNPRITTLSDTSFKVVGAKNYKTAKARKDTYVTFDKPRVKSVTRRHGNTKTITYFRRAK